MKIANVLISFAVALLLALSIPGVRSTRVTFTNNCQYTVWPATQPNSGSPQLSNTGFELKQGASNPIDLPAKWSGRFWARTGCNTDASGKFSCATAECGTGQVACNGNGGNPPLTLVEPTLNGNGDNSDTYDISLVNGYNVPVKVAPTQSSCPTITCKGLKSAACPSQLQKKDGNGNIIGCQNPCDVFHGDQYCCKPNDTPQTCPPTPLSQKLKNQCPQAYSYPKDDQSSTFHCPSGTDYTITFCP